MRDFPLTWIWRHSLTCGLAGRPRVAECVLQHQNLHPVKEATMKAKAIAILLTLALCFIGVAMVYAADAFMGTWKLNEAKSKLTPGAPKNNTVVYEATGGNVKITMV